MPNRLVALIDLFIRRTGEAIAWLTLAMVFTTFAVVVLRYGLEIGSIALQESVLYMHGCVFLLGAAYTLQLDGHVRVDILYRHMSERQRAVVDLLGTLLFLLPMCGFIAWIGWDYVLQAWRIREGSGEAGGLAYVYVLKTLLPVCTVLLALQGVAEALRAIGRLLGTPAAAAPLK